MTTVSPAHIITRGLNLNMCWVVKPTPGKNVTFGSSTGYGNPSQVEVKLASYPAGTPIIVYYNTKKPSEAVLECKADGFKIGMIIGIVLLVISVCIACVMAVAVIRNFVSV